MSVKSECHCKVAILHIFLNTLLICTSWFSHIITATDEKSKPGFVRTIVAVKGLRSASQMTMKGLKKKATNAEIESSFEQQ